MTTITYRGKHYDKEAYKAAVLAEQTATRNYNLMYRGIKIERKFASQSWRLSHLTLLGVARPSFLCYNDDVVIWYMEKERVNLIIRNLELLLDSLKAEVNSDRDDKVDYNPYSEYIEDYDEVFEEENDWNKKSKREPANP